MDQERKQELEELITDSYGVIREWERIRQTGRPEDKLDARRKIQEQWGHIERYLAEYRPIVGNALPENIAQIATHFGPVQTAAQRGPAQQVGTTYNIHIQHASGMAIGDGAQVIQQGAPPAGSPTVAPVVDIAALRARLQRLDAVQIESLCLDHFSEVYDKFGRGLRRDEMINLLLDHVRRNPQDAARLAGLLK